MPEIPPLWQTFASEHPHPSPFRTTGNNYVTWFLMSGESAQARPDSQDGIYWSGNCLILIASASEQKYAT